MEISHGDKSVISSGNNSVIAPFVMKTYQMVNDPTTNDLITWGKSNNSFIVSEPLDFSERILPVYFKHRNFSSFVRQLNTYGFRKVDSDNWEFANVWFLRGQTHLLCNIARRKHTDKSHRTNHIKHEEEDEGDEEDELFKEIAKLKQEQKSLEQNLESMNKRLEATEKRPQQMMTLLCKVARDPEVLPQLMMQRERTKLLKSSCNNINNNGENKRRKVVTMSDYAIAPSSSSIKSEDHRQERNLVGEAVTPISSPDVNLDTDPYYSCQSRSHEWLSEGHDAPLIMQENIGYYANEIGGLVEIEPPVNGAVNYYVDDRVVDGDDNASRPIPYPFSLFGGGF